MTELNYTTLDFFQAPLSEQQKALVWQCRRGIKEIEVLLVPFLEQHYVNESEQIRKAFVTLLKEADLDIFEWFMGRDKPDDPQLEEIIHVILKRLETKT